MDHRENAPYSSASSPANRERELLEWAASFSSRAAADLRRLKWAESEARAKRQHERELLEFLTWFSEKHERELCELLREEAEERESQERSWQLAGDQATQEEWVEADHPRQPAGTPEGGEWIPKGRRRRVGRRTGPFRHSRPGRPRRPQGRHARHARPGTCLVADKSPATAGSPRHRPSAKTHCPRTGTVWQRRPLRTAPQSVRGEGRARSGGGRNCGAPVGAAITRPGAAISRFGLRRRSALRMDSRRDARRRAWHCGCRSGGRQQRDTGRSAANWHRDRRRHARTGRPPARKGAAIEAGNYRAAQNHQRSGDSQAISGCRRAPHSGKKSFRRGRRL